MATIQDVARLAKVSISTVSNILNHKTNVSSEVYERVIKVMNDLNYNPNLLARNLKSNKTKFIGVVLPNLTGHYNQMLLGIQKIADANQYNVLLKLTDDIKPMESAVIEDLINLGVRGILLVSCNETDPEHFNAILSKGIPLVLLERYAPGSDYSSVRYANRAIVRDSVTRLLEQERKQGRAAPNLALIAGPKEFSAEQDCVNGFMEACVRNEMSLPDPNIVHVHLNQEFAFKEMVGFIRSLEAIPDFFITTNEMIAENLLEIIHLYGYGPQIIGLSGDTWHEFAQIPRLKKIKRSAISLGTQGMLLLHKYIKTPIIHENVQIVIPSVAETESVPAKLRPPEKAGQSAKLSLLLLEGPTSHAMIQLIPHFEQTSGVKVKYEQLNYKDLYRTINMEGSSDDATMDVFMLDIPWIQEFVQKKYLQELTPFVQKRGMRMLDDFLACIRNAFFDGSGPIYTIPVMVANQMLFYRRDLFENNNLNRMFFREYGIELHPPQTWTEFNLMAKFFTRAFNPQSPVEYGTSIVGFDSTLLIEEFLPRQWSYNGRFVAKDGRIAINSVENAKALANLVDSYRYSPPQSINYWWDDQLNEFSKGNLAMINTFNSHVSNMYDHQFRSLSNNITIGSIPGNTPVLGGWALGIHKKSRLSEEGFAFMEWVTSNQLCVHNAILGGFVPKSKLVENHKLQMVYPWIQNISSHLQTARKRETIKNKRQHILAVHKTEKILAEEIRRVLLNRATPAEALEAARIKLEASVHQDN